MVYSEILCIFFDFCTISKKSNLEGVFEFFYSNPQLDQNLKPTRNLCGQLLYIYIYGSAVGYFHSRSKKSNHNTSFLNIIFSYTMAKVPYFFFTRKSLEGTHTLVLGIFCFFFSVDSKKKKTNCFFFFSRKSLHATHSTEKIQPAKKG